MTILLLLLTAYGICFGFQHKIPFLWSRHYRQVGEPVTVLDRLLRCTYCVGFHVGWIIWLGMWAVTGSPLIINRVFGPTAHLVGIGSWMGFAVSLVLWCFATASWCYLVDAVASRLEIIPGYGEADDDEEEDELVD